MQAAAAALVHAAAFLFRRRPATPAAWALAGFLAASALLAAFRGDAGAPSTALRAAARAAAAAAPPAAPHTLVVYTTSAAESRPGSGNEREENLDFFLAQGLLPHDPGYHFVIVVAGAWEARRGALEGAVAWVAAHGVGNLQVIWRENTGFDFCSWREALADALPRPLKHDPARFSWFVLLNGSVRGPLLPAHWPRARAWPDAFVSLLRESGARLAGTTINCDRSRRWLHVQSMVLAFGARDLALVLDSATCFEDMESTVYRNEYGLSQAFLRDGANLAVLQLAWRGADFRDAARTDATCGALGRYDVYYPDDVNIGGPAGAVFDPLELLFFKTNRGILPEQVAHFTQWQLATVPAAVPAAALAAPPRADGEPPPPPPRKRSMWYEPALPHIGALPPPRHGAAQVTSEPAAHVARGFGCCTTDGTRELEWPDAPPPSVASSLFARG